MSTLSLTSTVVRSTDQVSTDLGGEAVILGLQSGEYFSLEGVGLRIWELLETPHTAADLLAAILAAYEVEAVAAERDLLAVLGALVAEGLVEVQ
ncbi:MAG: PqqD family peptide modification chaperone [Caldilineaceae bacterium]|nr:PqqD family peptide modification chaperone [Caldilineaceae bacterium]